MKTTKILSRLSNHLTASSSKAIDYILKSSKQNISKIIEKAEKQTDSAVRELKLISNTLDSMGFEFDSNRPPTMPLHSVVFNNQTLVNIGELVLALKTFGYDKPSSRPHITKVVGNVRFTITLIYESGQSKSIQTIVFSCNVV